MNLKETDLWVEKYPTSERNNTVIISVYTGQLKKKNILYSLRLSLTIAALWRSEKIFFWAKLTLTGSWGYEGDDLFYT